MVDLKDWQSYAWGILSIIWLALLGGSLAGCSVDQSTVASPPPSSIDSTTPSSWARNGVTYYDPLWDRYGEFSGSPEITVTITDDTPTLWQAFYKLVTEEGFRQETLDDSERLTLEMVNTTQAQYGRDLAVVHIDEQYTLTIWNVPKLSSTVPVPLFENCDDTDFGSMAPCPGKVLVPWSFQGVPTPPR